jgi:hypothetical protein
LDPDYAKGQLAASVYLQMALKPSIVHVVGYVEAHHAATPAVEIGLLDAPQLKGNPYACGQLRTRIINGANHAVDEEGRVLSEKARVERIFARL